MSQCIKSNGNLETWLWKGKGSLLCLARGQISQILLETELRSGSTFFKIEILALEGCPSLECHTETRILTLLTTWNLFELKMEWKTELKTDWKDGIA